MRISSVIVQHIVFILLCFAAPLDSAAQIGGYPGAFLKNVAGVRAFGLGGAYTAIADDISACYWNPAGLAYFSAPQIGAMYSSLSLDRQYNFAAVAWPFGSFGAINAGWISYQAGSINARDETGNVTGEITNEERAFLLSYGNQPTPGLAFGMTIKLLQHHLAHYEASGVGMDIGMLFATSEQLSIGVSLKNIGAQIDWNTPGRTKEILPKIARLGFSLKPSPALTTSMDYRLHLKRPGNSVSDANEFTSWHYGAEYLVKKILALRMGYDNGKFILGASVSVPTANNMIRIDYGLFSDPIDHSQHHKFGLVLTFTQKEPSILPAANTYQNPTLSTNGNASVLPKILYAKIVEITEKHFTLETNLNEGFRDGTMLKIYRRIFDTNKGAYYGTARVKSTKGRFTQIEMIKMREIFRELPFEAGEKIALVLTK